MAAAISAHLDLHPEHIDCALDSKNAFNSWCRSQMWQPLLDKFPSIYSLVKLMYGDASSVLFDDPGSGLCEIMNTVGCKQGCSLGSFLFSLAIHRFLSQLQEEFPDLLVIAYCDDVHLELELELELELIQTRMIQKPLLWVEVGKSACVLELELELELELISHTRRCP